MRCLLIAPSGGNLGVLPQVLQEAGLAPASSVDLGAGIALANADLSAFKAAVVVLPVERNRRGMQAVLLETGIAAGRDLPLIIIVPSDQTIPTALATIQVVKTDLTNREALSLHVGLFTRSLEAPAHEPFGPSSPPMLAPLNPEVADQFEARLASLIGSPQPSRGFAIEQFVVDLLSSAGANIEAEQGRHDRGFDAAAFIPGEEERLGLLVIEVKDRLDRASRINAERQLQSYVMDARAGLGLLLYVSSTSKTSTPTTPLVLSMPIGQLLGELRIRPLSRVLVHARNEAVHRM
ncbi:MAG TPA: hypothetical protein VK988_05640 [Acidimicrobiales bacterium]|nr:hypothetical protein [Acidimicrobiales bacterium]